MSVSTSLNTEMLFFVADDSYGTRVFLNFQECGVLVVPTLFHKENSYFKGLGFLGIFKHCWSQEHPYLQHRTFYPCVAFYVL